MKNVRRVSRQKTRPAGFPKLSEFVRAKQAEMDAVAGEHPTGDLITEPGERIPNAAQIEAMLDAFEQD